MLLLRLMVFALLQYQLRNFIEGTRSCRINSHITINEFLPNGRVNGDGIEQLEYIELNVDKSGNFPLHEYDIIVWKSKGTEAFAVARLTFEGQYIGPPNTMIVVGSPDVKASFNHDPAAQLTKFFTFEELSAETTAGPVTHSFFDEGNFDTIAVALYGQKANIRVGMKLDAATVNLKKLADVFFYQEIGVINLYMTQMLSPPIPAQESPSEWTLWGAVDWAPREYSDIVFKITRVDSRGRSRSFNYCCANACEFWPLAFKKCPLTPGRPNYCTDSADSPTFYFDVTKLGHIDRHVRCDRAGFLEAWSNYTKEVSTSPPPTPNPEGCVLFYDVLELIRTKRAIENQHDIADHLTPDYHTVPDNVLLELLKYGVPEFTQGPNEAGNEEERETCPNTINKKWFDDYPWLQYSAKPKTVYCKFCSLGFCTRNLPDKTELVRTKFTHIGKAANANLRLHQTREYHIQAVEAANRWLQQHDVIPGDDSISESPKPVRLSEEKKKKLHVALISVSKVVELLARQGVAFLRRDSGLTKKVKLSTMEYLFKSEHWLYSNFATVALMRIDAGDKDLYEHLTTGPANKRFTSAVTQNRLILLQGDFIKKIILDEGRASPFFAVIADGSVDKSITDQMSFVLRYLKEGKITESFVEYYDVTGSTTGRALATEIISRLRSYGLDPQKLRGQGYDGGSNMAAIYEGAQAHIVTEFKTAIYVHCVAHALNLVVKRIVAHQGAKDLFMHLSDLAVFYNTAKRRKVLRKHIGSNSAPRPLSRSRWVDTYNIAKHTKFSFPEIVASLTEIADPSNGWDNISREHAQRIKDNMLTFKFAYMLVLAVPVLKSIDLTSKRLQDAAIDYREAFDEVERDIIHFKSLLEGPTVQQTKDQAWKETTDMLKPFHVDPEVPRQRGTKQSKTEHPQPTEPRDYYETTFYTSFVRDIIKVYHDRFGGRTKLLPPIGRLVPSNFRIKKITLRALHDTIDFYNEDLHASHQQFAEEMERWDIYWIAEEVRLKALDQNLPSNVQTTLMALLERERTTEFPLIYKLLQIFAVVPVTSANAERSFSVMKLEKTYLRSRMSNERLNGLTRINIHKAIRIDHGVIAT